MQRQLVVEDALRRPTRPVGNRQVCSFLPPLVSLASYLCLTYVETKRRILA